MNKLCISKLLQFVDRDLVPVEITENPLPMEGAETTVAAGTTETSESQ